MVSSILRHLHQTREFPILEEEVFVGLHMVADRLMEPWAKRLREVADLTPVQYNVLRILRGAGRGGLLIGEIAERMMTRSPDVTRLIDRLERRGLVSRCGDAADRRAVRVQITPEGQERIAPLDGDNAGMLQRGLGALERQELVQLRDTLGRILDTIPVSPPGP